jgi:hypothetical protein
MLSKRNYDKLCKVLDNAAYIYYNKEDKSIILILIKQRKCATNMKLLILIKSAHILEV